MHLSLLLTHQHTWTAVESSGRVAGQTRRSSEDVIKSIHHKEVDGFGGVRGWGGHKNTPCKVPRIPGDQ